MEYLKNIGKFTIMGMLLIALPAYGASLIFPYQGGTGIATVPTYGQILLGNSSGTYTLSATSTLGVLLSDTVGTLSILRGGTGSTTAPQGQLLYGGATSYQSVATSSIAVGSGISVTSGTLGAQVGGTNVTLGIANTAITNAMLANSTISGVSLGGTLGALTATNASLTFSGSYTGAGAQTVGLNVGNANNWTALQTFSLASSTLLSVTSKAYFGATATTTIDSTGNIVIPSGSNLTITGKTDGCATWLTGVLNSTGVACGSGGSGIGDPFTHPATGQSATTSLMLFYGNASTTQFTATSSVYLATVNGTVGIGTTSPSKTLSIQGNQLLSGDLSLANLTATGTVTISAAGSLIIASHRIIDDALGGFAFQPTSGTTNVDFTSTYNQFNTDIRLGGNARASLGTTTPQWQLTIASSTGPQMALGDGTAGNSLYTFRTISNSFYISTTTTFATSTNPVFTILNGGFAGLVGFGTSTPFARLSVDITGIISGWVFSIGSSVSTLFHTTSGGQTTTCETKVATSSVTTVDWIGTTAGTACNKMVVGVGTSAMTIQFKNATTSAEVGGNKLLIVCNPGAGTAGALTFVGIEWAGATVPTQTTTANQCDVYSFFVTSATSTTNGTTASYKILGGQSSGYQ